MKFVELKVRRQDKGSTLFRYKHPAKPAVAYVKRSTIIGASDTIKGT